MKTTGTKHLRLETPRRHSADRTLDDLFQDVILDARWAKGLVHFAEGLRSETNEDEENKMDTSAVMAFVEALRGPIDNVVDALGPILYELKQREAERRA